MPWTAQQFIDAYRLTVTPELAARALASGVARTEGWLGQPAFGGRVRWTWRRQRWLEDAGMWGLPEQCLDLLSVTIGGESAADSIHLANNGWSLRRQWPVVYAWGDIVAEGIVADDGHLRDSIAASLALQEMGYSGSEQGRGWRMALRDSQGPPARGRLPEARAVIAAGTPDSGAAPAPSSTWVGTVAAADSVVNLADLRVERQPEFGLPFWQGARYLVFVRESDEPLSRIIIGGFDQTGVFAPEALVHGGASYRVWRSRRAWEGAIAGGALVHVD